MGVPLRRRGYRDAYKFVMHYNNITWLQRTGSSTEIFYILNWAVHIVGKDLKKEELEEKLKKWASASGKEVEFVSEK